MGRVRLSLIALCTLALSSPAFATYQVNAAKPWMRVVGPDGSWTAVRDLPAGALPDTVKIPITGVNGYNNISAASGGARLARTAPLVSNLANDAGIIRGTEVGLSKPITGAVTDAVVATAPAIGAAARFAIREAVPYVGLAIGAWSLYDALTNDGISWSPDLDTLAKDETIEQTPTHSYQVVRTAVTNGYPTSGAKPANGTIAGSSGGLTSLADAWAGSAKCRTDVSSHWSPAIFIHGGGSGGADTARAQCKNDTSGNVYGSLFVDATDIGTNCPDGFEISGSTCVQHHERPATDQEIEDAISDEPASRMPDLVQEVAQKGDGTLSIPKSSAASVEGLSPSYDTAPSETSSTRHNSDGSDTVTRTETTQHVEPTVQGDTVGDQTVTVNVTNITNTYINNELTEYQQQQQDPVPQTDPPADQQQQPQVCDDGACAFDGPDIPEAKTFTESLTGLYNDLASSPLASVLTGIGDLFPSGGECPTAQFDVLEHHFVIDSQCVLMDMYRSTIQSIMLFFYFLGGLVLFFKA